MFKKPVSHLQLKARLRRDHDAINRSDLFHGGGFDTELAVIVKNGANKEDNEGFLPIHTGVLYAQDTGRFQTILMQGANINETDKAGRNCLHWAVLARRPEMVKYLLEQGLDPNVKMYGGANPLHLAILSHYWSERVFEEHLFISVGPNSAMLEIIKDLAPVTKDLFNEVIARIYRETKYLNMWAEYYPEARIDDGKRLSISDSLAQLWSRGGEDRKFSKKVRKECEKLGIHLPI